MDKWRGRLLGVELGVELCSSSAGSSGEAAALCWTMGGTASTGRWDGSGKRRAARRASRHVERVGEAGSRGARAWTGAERRKEKKGEGGRKEKKKKKKGKRRRKEKKKKRGRKRERAAVGGIRGDGRPRAAVGRSATRGMRKGKRRDGD